MGLWEFSTLDVMKYSLTFGKKTNYIFKNEFTIVFYAVLS